MTIQGSNTGQGECLQGLVLDADLSQLIRAHTPQLGGGLEPLVEQACSLQGTGYRVGVLNGIEGGDHTSVEGNPKAGIHHCSCCGDNGA